MANRRKADGFTTPEGMSAKQARYAAQDTMSKKHKDFVAAENKKGALSAKLQKMVKKEFGFSKPERLKANPGGFADDR